MTQSETAQILALLNAAYPAFYSKYTKEEIKGIVSLWAEMFAEDDFGIVKYALKELIATHSGYPPDIAALKGKIKAVIQSATDKPTHEELWQKLKRAVSNGYYGAKEEYEKLPPILQRYVGSPATLREYAVIDSDTFNTVNHGQFLKQIKIIEEREEYESRMPAEVKMLISSVHMGEQKQLTNGDINDMRNYLLERIGE